MPVYEKAHLISNIEKCFLGWGLSQPMKFNTLEQSIISRMDDSYSMVAMNKLLCLKNAGAQIPKDFS